MILGFVLGWCAATYWWPWVLSFYEKPKRQLYAKDGELFALLEGKSTNLTITSSEGGGDGVRGIRWRKDGGP